MNPSLCRRKLVAPVFDSFATWLPDVGDLILGA
jgi:hypothetical protein